MLVLFKVMRLKIVNATSFYDNNNQWIQVIAQPQKEVIYKCKYCN